MSCSRTHHGDACGDRFQNISIRSPTLYHYATSPPNMECIKLDVHVFCADKGLSYIKTYNICLRNLLFIERKNTKNSMLYYEIIIKVTRGGLS